MTNEKFLESSPQTDFISIPFHVRKNIFGALKQVEEQQRIASSFIKDQTATSL